MVSSLFVLTCRAVPNIEISVFSSFKPISSEITWPPVTVAISANISFLLSPNPGALTATQFSVPLILFTINVARASPSTSSAIINKGFPICATFSKMGNNPFILLILASVISINGSSSTASILSASVTI